MTNNFTTTAPRQRIGRSYQADDVPSNLSIEENGNGINQKDHHRRSRISWTLKSANWTHPYVVTFCVAASFVCLIGWWIRQHAAVSETHKTAEMARVMPVELTTNRFTEADIVSNLAKTVTAYLETTDSKWLKQKPLPFQSTSASKLTAIKFPQVSCFQDRVENFPIDDYPMNDPYLPWIHDYFPTLNGTYVQFVAQNKRRCNTGKEHEKTMKFWEPQMSLFQPVPVDLVDDVGDNTSSTTQAAPKYRLATSPEKATFPETRFMCYFHNNRGQEETTFSEFSFNYEYVTWRKGKSSMMATTGKDADQFWLSQLLFRCPVPRIFQEEVQSGRHVLHDKSDQWISQLWLDLVPIRTPTRHEEFLFTKRHVGHKHLKDTRIFDPMKAWGNNHVLPAVADSGRWANLPICRLPSPRVSSASSLLPETPTKPSTTSANAKPFRLVACTWTAASYTRRGDDVSVSDSAKRLREWIVFHLMVGFDHLYVYDNSQNPPSPLRAVAMEFQDRVTYHPWPCKICNNNRPNHPNPGERSSQYAAEASCRERYGPMADWMAFIDTDEYLVPMMPDSSAAAKIPTWRPVLDKMDAKQIRILQMKSSRAKPRHDLMEVLADQSMCKDVKYNHRSVPTEPCLGPRQNETLLRVYNCEFIKPPRPSRFARAMKQIYRTDYVLSHFVHYSTVTVDVAQYFADHPASALGSKAEYVRNVHRKDWHAPETFLDELTEGTLIHTRSVLAHETMRRSHECYLHSKYNCILGFPCPESVDFVDGLYQNNGFHDEAGKYCNCWPNQRIESVVIPRLEALLLQGSAA